MTLTRDTLGISGIYRETTSRDGGYLWVHLQNGASSVLGPVPDTVGWENAVLDRAMDFVYGRAQMAWRDGNSSDRDCLLPFS